MIKSLESKQQSNQGGYSRELVEQQGIKPDQPMVVCGPHYLAQHKYVSGKGYTDETVAYKAWLCQQGTDNDGNEYYHQPFLVKLPLSLTRELPLGTRVKLDNLVAVRIHDKRTNRNHYYYKADGIEPIK